MSKDNIGSIPPSNRDNTIAMDNSTRRSKNERLAGLEARASEGQARTSGRYSYFVGIMRYALPLVAILLLGLIVIWPLMTGREDGFRISYSEMKDVDGSLKMINARYIGSDERNQPYTVSASEASQPEPNSSVIMLSNITADIFAKEDSGEWYALTAEQGVYERDLKLLDLSGTVTLFSDSGHELITPSAHIDLGRGIAEGNEPIQGQSPLGLLNAGNFRIIDRGQTTFFGNRVKLVIFPNAHNG